MQTIFKQLAGYPPFEELKKAAEGRLHAAAYDISEGQRVFLACALAASTGRQVLYVTPSWQAAVRAADDCGQLLPGRAGALPAPETQFARATASRETDWQRIEMLTLAQTGALSVLCAPADALLYRCMPPSKYREHTITVRTGDRLLPQDLVAGLVRIGYERVDMVEGKGQCALRGAIVDVFPPSGQDALRVEFFDDEVDSLRTFDCISQRSLKHTQEERIPPATEYLLDEGERRDAGARLRAAVMSYAATQPADPLSADLPPLPEDEKDEDGPRLPAASRKGFLRLLEDADIVASGGLLHSAGMLANILLPVSGTLPDWLDGPIIILDTPDHIRTRCEDRKMGFAEELQLALTRREAIPAQEKLLLDYSDVLEDLKKHTVLTLQEFLRGMSGITPRAVVRFPGTGASKYLNNIKNLASDMFTWQREGFAVRFLAGGAARGKRLQAALQSLGSQVPMAEDADAELPAAVILPLTLSRGFIMAEAKLAVLSDSDLYGAGYRKARSIRNAGERIEAFTDLKEGDYVVHEHHGVGIFRGTQRLQSEGTYRDYLYIQYRGNDKLYVPVDQFDRVQKYIGGQDTTPELNQLGGGEWQRQKRKVKAGLKKLAIDLVELYAARRAVPGHAYAKDSPWLPQFEDSFPYELTPDQARAVRDITRDMESPTNMDRLVCGDVGYGKTEVALRAAFKAVMDGKQVAMLAPTTILAQQHYYTIQKRFEEFPVTVGVLSRFSSHKAQRETLSSLAAGKPDIIVGTHRLLSRDVRFKDLGLLIVDEEQRFGVGHKEAIKNLKKTMDVLTLSATPIPRTLHMSMVGVRDMSLLETPPEERYPVQTYVLDYNDSVIRDAILRELARGGQVFFLYNRVASIDKMHARLKALTPEARIAVAHGQMSEHGLEDVMMDFYAGNFDVLLCSTIIENGLDVSRANTLIVFDADRFGLSQLYQLRGRVGRSNRVAYAYFTVRPDKMLSETAEKRLGAIKQFTEFGSGFRIAMRDLEIRGAGNIFGPEQSGHVSAVGYDMYCKLIEEAVREARGDADAERESEMETRVDLKTDAFLPADYVRGEAQRMEMYKRISLLKTRDDREDVIEEMVDRFGEPPLPVMNLIDIAHLRALCGRLGVSRVTHTTGTMVFHIEEKYLRDPLALVAGMQKADVRLLLSAQCKPAMLLRDKRLSAEEMLRAAVPVMEKLLEAMGMKADARQDAGQD